ncbi:MAG: hypothetical protein M0Z93_06580 [Actinomycetota bacterium]|jgi:hypothetical protein|nr:hypothetical protein [Actinomycetota bacterium]
MILAISKTPSPAAGGPPIPTRGPDAYPIAHLGHLTPMAGPVDAAPGTIRVVPWIDPVADPLGVHPCARYVELYWLGILGPSATWLLRRIAYGLEIHPGGFTLHLAETARALGLGERQGRNAPFPRALQRLVTFELARPTGAAAAGSLPGDLAVRTRVPPLPLRHLQRLPASLQASHRQWQAEQRLPPAEQARRRAHRLAASLAASGCTREEIEARLGVWHFHPALAYQAASGVATPGECRPDEDPR